MILDSMTTTTATNDAAARVTDSAEVLRGWSCARTKSGWNDTQSTDIEDFRLTFVCGTELPERWENRSVWIWSPLRCRYRSLRVSAVVKSWIKFLRSVVRAAIPSQLPKRSSELT